MRLLAQIPTATPIDVTTAQTQAIAIAGPYMWIILVGFVMFGVFVLIGLVIQGFLNGGD
ncbi:MAG TPA: hypothetical protein VLK33_08970 [Terriglobales bacterium]|nr:hypothetical protein [Terriglobales bacterium]